MRCWHHDRTRRVACGFDIQPRGLPAEQFVTAKRAAAMIIVCLLGLTGGTVLVATKLAPSSSTNGAAHGPSTTYPRTPEGIMPKLGPATRPAHGSSSPTTSTTAPVTTGIPTTQPTTFVVSTITYVVKTGDTVSSIAHWFDLRGYEAQFAANLQVIESNKKLLVPGATVTIASGVMTIQSPA